MAVSNSMFYQLNTFKNVVKPRNITYNLLKRITSPTNNAILYSTVNTATAVENTSSKTENPKIEKKMSKAMLVYLERAKAHDEFILKEKQDFIIGKRHLANMMGEDPEHFTQQDIDRAIEYLLPSGLFDKHARPLMKPPEDIFPPRKAAEFDETGRPYHSLFYTSLPMYYQALHNIVEQLKVLNALEDENIRKGIPPDQNDQFDTSSSDWVKKIDLEKILLEVIRDEDYEYFISSFDRLVEHPYSNHASDLISKFRVKRQSLIHSFAISPLESDAEGRPFITVLGCRRKSAHGSVTIKGKGSGKITVNGKSLITYFPESQEREQVR